MFIAGSMSGEEGVKSAQKISIDGGEVEEAPGTVRKRGDYIEGVPAGVRDPVAAAQRQPERREMVGVPVMGPQSFEGTGAASEPVEGSYEKFMTSVVGPPRRIRRRPDEENVPAWWDQQGYEPS